MKKYKITEKSGNYVEYHTDIQIDPTAMGHGLPAREEIGEDGQPTGVILPAEYTVEIEDITAAHELAQVLVLRKAEYPSPEEFMNAYFDGGQAALDALQAARLAVKAKYPKPGV